MAALVVDDLGVVVEVHDLVVHLLVGVLELLAVVEVDIAVAVAVAEQVVVDIEVVVVVDNAVDHLAVKIDLVIELRIISN